VLFVVLYFIIGIPAGFGFVHIMRHQFAESGLEFRKVDRNLSFGFGLVFWLPIYFWLGVLKVCGVDPWYYKHGL
jgi:hypothetical protein